MKEVYVGTYEMGAHPVRLYVASGTGAHTEFMPKDKLSMTMTIGMNHKHWRHVLGSLLHEAQESGMYNLGLSYQNYGWLNNQTSSFMFMMTHEQFEECCCRAADLISNCQVDLHAAWQKWQKHNKKGGK